MIILIELLAGKGDLHAVYGCQHGIFQHAAVNALHTAKQRAPGHVVRDRPGFVREQRELDHLGGCRGEGRSAPSLAIQPFAAQAAPIGRAAAGLSRFRGSRDRVVGILALYADCSSASSFCKTASMMYACHDGFTMRFSQARSIRCLISSVSRSWKFLVFAWDSSCVATLPPFSIKALTAASWLLWFGSYRHLLTLSPVYLM